MTRLQWQQQLYRLQQRLEARVEVQQQLLAELRLLQLAAQGQLEQHEEGLQQVLQRQQHTLAVQQHLQQQMQQLQQDQSFSDSLLLFDTPQCRQAADELQSMLQEHQLQLSTLQEQQQHELLQQEQQLLQSLLQERQLQQSLLQEQQLPGHHQQFLPAHALHLQQHLQQQELQLLFNWPQNLQG